MFRATLRLLNSRISQNFMVSQNVPGPVFCSTETQQIVPVTPPVAAPIIGNYSHEEIRVTSEEPRQAWVDNLTSIKEEKVGLISLHPDIFAAVPRVDIIHENIVWQDKYKDINYRHAKVPVEMRGPGKGFGPKPWPQKGTGRARQKSTRGPHWHKGGTIHGPRRYTTKFFMLPFQKRVMGLIYTLSCKLAQDDLKVVPDLEVPSDDGNFLEEMLEERSWGPSALFVDVEDMMPRNITLATEKILHLNLLPVYGLNVHSMIKHDTLILTVAAVRKLEERLLYNLHCPRNSNRYVKY